MFIYFLEFLFTILFGQSEHMQAFKALHDSAVVACALFDVYKNLYLDNTLLYMHLQITVFLCKCVTNHKHVRENKF